MVLKSKEVDFELVATLLLNTYTHSCAYAHTHKSKAYGSYFTAIVTQ